MTELQQKLKEVRRLAKNIDGFHKKHDVTPIQLGKSQELQDRMEFRLKELRDYAVLREAEIKIETMTDMLSFLNQSEIKNA